MNIRMLKHLGVVAALAGAMLTASVANAAIVVGSKAQIFGTAFIDGAGNIVPIGEQSGSTTPPVDVLVGAGGNTLSFSGYNRPNPAALSFAPNYTATMAQIPAAGPFGFTLLSLPAVVNAVDEPGPSVIATFFRLSSWTPTITGSFFTAFGLGVIEDAQGNFLSNGRFEFSSQGFTPGGENAFSGTLVATSVIPVPGAMWIFGSGLLLMTAVMRRKVK